MSQLLGQRYLPVPLSLLHHIELTVGLAYDATYNFILVMAMYI